MQKITTQFILNQYRSGIKSYSDFTKEVGLWDSEKYVFQKYLEPTDKILDLGCGTGRTTFPLVKLGYKNIVAIDLTPEMIEAAQSLNQYFEMEIDFRIGDATDLEFEALQFDTIIFSFNGLMSIPKQSNRDAALKEINRVLKNGGTFIFTTHDRAREKEFFEFWKTEKEKWDQGTQNPSLYEFGDLVTTSKNESREIFIHIPIEKEITDWLNQHHFEVVETFYRVDRFDEREAVKMKSGECRFWIVKKVG